MAIWGCGFPARCCQPAVAGGIIYADLSSELNTPLAPQALFTQSPVRKPLLQAFPFPSTLGEVTLHLLSQASVFIYSLHGKWVFPRLLWSFPPSITSFPAPGCWVHNPPPPPGPACLFTVPGRIPLPASLELRAPHPLCHVLFLLLITQFLFFPRVGVSLSRGLCWSCQGLSVEVPCTA
jgi:hypothetical protein